MEEYLYLKNMLISVDKNSRTDFSKKRYETDFEQFMTDSENDFNKLFEYVKEHQDLESMSQLASEFIKDTMASIELIAGKRKQKNKIFDYNLDFVMYLFPGLIKYDAQGKVLAEKIAELWKERFPEYDIKAVSYEQIMEGFKHKFCYITTAVCESLGKTDDCYELTALRNYRDNYLMNTDCGEEIVRKYYDIAPTIVKHIDKRPERREIYEGIWNHYLKQCIQFIETEQNEQCKDLYATMVLDLQNKFFS